MGGSGQQDCETSNLSILGAGEVWFDDANMFMYRLRDSQTGKNEQTGAIVHGKLIKSGPEPKAIEYCRAHPL